MNAIFYLLIPLVLFTVLLYPLLRKAVALLEILVNKHIQQTTAPQGNADSLQATAYNLKLLAYERITLLIERLKPDSLIPRTLSPELNYKEYQLLLLNEIRKEFEYNLSQQLYLSDNAWIVTVNFKDNVITLINSAASECQPNDNANQLGQKILERYITSGAYADKTLKIVKEEIGKN
ncbi:MAG: hypothetical protein K2I90_01250 [Odoribacter sp.]|nr:hypothetical protein [Odoribacter sp.]